jgi:hypothetical protein
MCGEKRARTTQLDVIVLCQKQISGLARARACRSRDPLPAKNFERFALSVH